MKCFGLRYTVCFDLSRADDVIRVIEGKIYREHDQQGNVNHTVVSR